MNANLGKTLTRKPVRLVGIGASAGGLEALRDLMGSLPKSDCLSYIIAQHVSPHHISMLINLLKPLTPLEVRDLQTKQKPQPGIVYITPPNHDVILEKGYLCLTETQHAIGPKPSVNRFFLSLSEELKEQSIGIILSGTGSDGASGIQAIKAAGGITITQKPETAKYDGMPNAAIHTGSVDLILGTTEIGSVLERLLKNPEDLSVILPPKKQDSDEYTDIYTLVRNYTAFKLDAYKSGTIKRRIARRMSILGISTLAGYIERLKQYKEESRLLVRDIFISVTFFFRDQEPFLALEKVINNIVNKQEKDKIIRCWVPGCASGEEVYSIAMLFEEAIVNQQRSDLQYVIFASDLDDAAIERARVALYLNNDLNAIPKNLIDTYTENAGDHFRIAKNIRNRIVFAKQNVIVDPPFGRLDLISCRNLLIYLNQDIQKKVLEMFHYALNPDGYLFLGKSESIDTHKDLFKPENRTACIYTRQPGTACLSVPEPNHLSVLKNELGKSNDQDISSTRYISTRTLEELTQRYAPPSVVINEENNIVHFEGNLKPYLNFPKGKLDMYLFEIVCAPFRVELRALVFRCRRESKRIEGKPNTFKIDSQPFIVVPVVQPLDHGKTSLLIISFITQSIDQHEHCSEASLEASEHDNIVFSELEQELANTRTQLNTVVEELETSSEELQSLNEELQSSNEELQSTVEELQTSNQELQSTNEELLTVNEELQVKSDALEKTSTDLLNVKKSLDFPLLVVDKQLHITQANYACAEIIAYSHSLENTSLNSAQWRLEMPGLLNTIRDVINHGNSMEKVVYYTDADKVFLLNIMPYRNINESITGAILLFNNISAQHLAEAALQESEVRFHQAMRHAPLGIALHTTKGELLDINPELCNILGYQRDELLSRNLQSITYPDDAETYANHVKELQRGEKESFAMDARYFHKNKQIIWTALHSAPVKNEKGKTDHIISLIQNITLRKNTENELRLAARVFSNALDGIIIADNKTRIIKVNNAFEKMHGFSSDEIIGKYVKFLRSHKHDNNFYRVMWREIYEKGCWQGEVWSRHKDGHGVPVWISISALRNPGDQPDHYIAVMHDISEQKHYHEKINYLAHYDALTKLPNRILFRERLQHAIANAKRKRTKLALLFIDLDNFKHINDSRGHHVGDELLCNVASRLNATLRLNDTVSRLSGDEFTVLIEDEVDEDKLSIVAEKILTAIAKPYDLSGGSAYISASIGLTLFPDDGDCADTLLKHADLAMYRSKESGRNHFHFFTQEMSKRVSERMLLHTDLRQALRENELQLHYQPIIDIGSKTCIGAEALLRWKHSDLGWVSPHKFISVAEDNDLIHPIGEWVLQQACRQIKTWEDQGINPGFLSVNVSGKQLNSNNFVKNAQTFLEEINCSPESIVLEMTESFIMKESEGAISALNKLRELGFSIAIDDFGIGYSSLSYLKRLPINKLKLDKSFVDDLPNDTNDIAITRAIIGLGSTLGLDIIAEGVETISQHEFLASEKCLMGQGYHYGKPMTPTKFKKYLLNA